MEGLGQTSKILLSFRPILKFLFPPNCVECGALISDDPGLCPACWQKLNFIEPPICDRLGVPFEYDPGPDILSAEALTNPPNYSKARYVARFDDVASSLIQKMKYRDQNYLAKYLGALMVKSGEELLKETSLILPVPLHKKRLFMRRYNQASLLAEVISRHSGIPIDHLLLSRRVPTRTQIGLSAKERRANVAGAFHIDDKNARSVKGKTVLLVDDVVTTGSTIEACTHTLLQAGAKSVNVLAFARVTDRVKTL